MVCRIRIRNKSGFPPRPRGRSAGWGSLLRTEPDEDAAEERPAPAVDEVLLVGRLSLWGNISSSAADGDHADHHGPHALHGPFDERVPL